MSQIFDIGPRFFLMISRKKNCEKIIEIFPFFDIKIKLRPILKFETRFPPKECYKHAGKVSK